MNRKKVIETSAKTIFLICAVAAVIAVASITVYMFMKGRGCRKIDSSNSGRV